MFKMKAVPATFLCFQFLPFSTVDKNLFISHTIAFACWKQYTNLWRFHSRHSACRAGSPGEQPLEERATCSCFSLTGC